MTFSPKNLTDNETVAVDLHPHWWNFAPPAGTLLAGVVFGIWRLTMDGGFASDAMSYIAIGLLIVGAVWLVIRYVKWTTTHFVITNRRIIYRTGVIAAHGVEIPLERVNNVNFSQTIFERVVGAGDLLIESGGEDGQSRFSDIRDPQHVQRMVHIKMEEAMSRRAGGEGGSAGGGAADIASQLERLEGLMERGALTREEFELQKRKLLG
jgi:uncharacterized membrane protein YdbT with pleckstrin-like domain